VARDRDRVEAGEPLPEVQGNREVVDVAGELDFLTLQQVQRSGRLAENPRGHGLHVDRVARQVEVVQPDHPRSAVVAVLVIGDVDLNVVACLVAHHGAPGRPEMAVQGKEHLIVAVDKFVPDLLAEARQVRLPVLVGVRDLVRGQDHRNFSGAGQLPRSPLPPTDEAAARLLGLGRESGGYRQ